MTTEAFIFKSRSARLHLAVPVFGIWCLFAAGYPATAALTDDFFEKRIRPVLVERCFKCHSAQAEKLKANLFLDSRDGAIKGGDTGPAVVPGTPEKSLLLKALSYSDPDLQMPPSKSGGKLPDAQIADFRNWIQQGAVWPAPVAAKSESKNTTFNLEKRRQEHWAWQSVKKETPPRVKDSKWPASPIDNFILAKLEARGIKPAPPADKRTLIRRATFDLIGLPPAPEEVEAFLRDKSKDAFAKVVDRLLASPHFGERWARHWLDRVRYSETMGHEFDYSILQAWRYRDYVIRALNQDVPYDRFVMEQLAGDLLDPRLDPGSGVNESAAATAFYWFVQQVHSPVDVRQEQADIIDNQIDVVSKAFLGMTVACARCHDHKFDAISTKDFYSLYGVLSSSRYSAGILNSGAMIEAAKPLPELKAKLLGQLTRAWETEAKQFAGQLLATTNGGAAKSRITAAVDLEQIRSLAHPFYAWSRTATSPDFGVATRNLVRELERKSAMVSASWTNYEDFPDFSKWFRDGPAFARTGTSDFLLGTNSAQPVVALMMPGDMHSGAISSRLQGELRSPTFTIGKRFVHALASGRGARLRVVIDNFTLIRSPIYGGLNRRLENDAPRWTTFDLEMWQGHRAYLEMSATEVNDPASETPIARGKNASEENPWGALSRAVFSDMSMAPSLPVWPVTSVLRHADSLAGLAEEYQKELIGAIRAWGAGAMDAAQFALLDWAVRNRIWTESANDGILNLAGEIFKTEEKIPSPIFVAAMTEGSPLDESVFIRGNHRKPGEVVPRCFLRGLEGPEPPPFTGGSGRLELARKIADPKNPLTTRVMVNGVWHHFFGRGIVPTVDNFGVLGEKPSHPELLDWLAASLVAPANSQAPGGKARAWSVKGLIREIMLSRAYQMKSDVRDLPAEERDPNNGLFHRMNVRRLEGETIRDSMLAVSGRLDPAMFGEPVPVHLTPFMDGRGKPTQSGPLDGDGRRSIYQEVRRNFISPMMLAFDTPAPASTVGRRSVSNVPAQALILMNDPFVVGEARRWAKKVLDDSAGSDSQRVNTIYLSAFGRLPAKEERNDALAFLRDQDQAYEPDAKARERAWADFCHVMFNTKEFIFVN